MKKIFSKFFSILLVILIVFSFSFTCVAVEGDTNEQNDYFTYIAHFGDFENAADDVAVTADKFSAEGNVNILNGEAVWTEADGSITADFSVPADGLYNIGISYKHFGESSADIKFGMRLDGLSPFADCENLTLKRFWKNETDEKQIDYKGNEFAPEQVALDEYKTVLLTDSVGVVSEPYLFALTAGTHQITILAIEGIMSVNGITVSAPQEINSYKTVKAQYEGKKYAKINEPIIIQGEDADIKSAASIIPEAEKNSANITPSSPYHGVLNYIGGDNWASNGDSASWKFKVEKSGLYKISFRYRQREVVNGTSYRSLKIDDEIPFKEANEIAFGYCRDWTLMDYADKNGNSYVFYLEAGEHTLTLTATLGPMSDFYSRLSDIVSSVGDRYLQIIMITGETPDKNRDYELFKQIPDFINSLKKDQSALDKLADDLGKVTGKDDGQFAASLRNMARVIGNMIDNKYDAQNYLSDYYDSYTTVSLWLSDMRSMPVAFDSIEISAPDYKSDKKTANFIDRCVFSFRRFLNSFTEDYSTSQNTKDYDIKLWVNWGRDQAQILNSMINDSFTPESGYKVKFEVVTTGIVQGLLSGEAPDISLMLSRSDPVNLAMRGALYDLTKFDDFDETLKRFQKDAATPYYYNGGCYALPDTQSFMVMFYRTDVLENLDIDINNVNTWDEFRSASVKILRNNMQVSLPYTKIASSTTTNVGVGNLSLYPTLLMQRGMSMYNSKLNATNLLEETAISTFTDWTELYDQYKIIKEANFYNRFKLGTMPLGIAPYTIYVQLQTAAPEIQGKWGVALVPGTMDESGNINRSVAGAGTGAAILKTAKNKKAAWEFLKWWTRDDTQFKYNERLENTLGPIMRVTTSNVEAFTDIAWDKKDETVLLEQWSYVTEIPETPGSYYVGRSLDQAFWETIGDDGTTPREALTRWAKIADNEIKRKIEEYN